MVSFHQNVPGVSKKERGNFYLGLRHCVGLVSDAGSKGWGQQARSIAQTGREQNGVVALRVEIHSGLWRNSVSG